MSIEKWVGGEKDKVLKLSKDSYFLPCSFFPSASSLVAIPNTHSKLQK